MNWVPEHLKEGRFRNTIESAPDWTISRNRFWASPLPIWKADSGEVMFVNSVEDLKSKTKKNGARIFIARHGQAENNVLGIISSDPNRPHHLTEIGRKQAEEVGARLISEKIDLIYVSPFVRTQETAKIIATKIGLSEDKIITDIRLHEVYTGELDGKSDAEYQKFFGSREEKFDKTPPGGENHTDAKRRMTECLYDVYEKNPGKNILIVSHNTPLWLMVSGSLGYTPQQAVELRREKHDFIKTGEFRELDFVPIPHNHNYELDLHRPYMMKRVANTEGYLRLLTVGLSLVLWFSPKIIILLPIKTSSVRTRVSSRNLLDILLSSSLSTLLRRELGSTIVTLFLHFFLALLLSEIS
jgi:broad specificity phosphatase PhoE